jgi:LysR family transcriptional regulator, transcriptional activator of nhaA
MSFDLNYHHLYYFWVVGKEGSMVRAAERLGVAVQTISAQVHALEKSLGCGLLRPAGRGLVLTQAGHAAMRQAEQIFLLGEQLAHVVRDAVDMPQVRLAVGVSDGLHKLATQYLMRDILLEPSLRLIVHEDEFADLLGDLALHRFDVVLADRPVHAQPNLKLYSHLLCTSPVAWYAPQAWLAQARQDFPYSLAKVPVLLPTHHAVVRARLDAWFERLGIKPHVVGEFEDSALLKTFASAGMGIFPAAQLVQTELLERYPVQWVGNCEGVTEQFFAIAAEKLVQHPLVQRMLQVQAG